MDKNLEKIYKAGLKFLVPLTLSENYALVVKEAMKLVGADKGSILIEQAGQLQRTYASSPDIFKNRQPMILTPKEIAERTMKIARFTHTHHQVVLDDKLLQVVNNLIDNAAKFSPQGTDITLTLKYHSPYLILTVTDQGEGISQKDLPGIFESFYQGQYKQPGMGLGLFIAKNIIRRHRGFIKIRTKNGVGTSVDVILPRVSRVTP